MTEWKKANGGLEATEPVAEALAPITDVPGFQAAAEAFGGDLSAWPAARRREAEAFLERGGEGAAAARAALVAESAFDAMLDQAAFVDARLSEDQRGRFLAGAERAAPGFADQLAYGARDMLWALADRIGEQISPDRGLSLSLSDFGFRSPLGGLATAAAVAGVVFGLYGPLDGAVVSTQTASAALFDPLSADEEINLFVLDFDDLSEERDG